jgi:hypothetical protein
MQLGEGGDRLWQFPQLVAGEVKQMQLGEGGDRLWQFPQLVPGEVKVMQLVRDAIASGSSLSWLLLR